MKQSTVLVFSVMALALTACQEETSVDIGATEAPEVAEENKMCQEVFDTQIKKSLASASGINLNDESTQATFYGTSLRYHIDQCSISSNPSECSTQDVAKYLTTKIDVKAESVFEMPADGAKQKCQVSNLTGTTSMQLIPNGPITTYTYTLPLFEFAFTVAKDGVHYTTEYINDFPFSMDNANRVAQRNAQNNLNAILMQSLGHNTAPVGRESAEEIEQAQQIEQLTDSLNAIEGN